MGIVGIFVPGLPSTVFVLISAYAASRGSDRLHRYLLRHPRFVPMIENWQRQGAVSRRAKRAASVAMMVCATLLLVTTQWAGTYHWWMAAMPIACMAVVLAWLWRRPEPTRPE